MLELVISVCLFDNPKHCKEVSLSYMEEGVSQHQCMRKSPGEIAKWNEAHPKWFMKKWTCRPAGRYADI